MCPAISSSSSPGPLLDLPLPLLELTLACLPLRSVLAVSSTCKHLNSLVSSVPFSRLHSLTSANRSPWFFLFGINHLLPNKNQAFAFDPLSRSWTRLPFIPPPPHNHSSLSGMNGTLFALAGAKQIQLIVASLPLKQNWQVIEASMEVSRCSPLVGIVGNPATPSSCSIVIAGGVDNEVDDQLAVEMYNGTERRWQRCPSLPEPLHGLSLSSAVVNEKFYVADCYSGTICCFDTARKMWASAKCERPRGAIFWHLVACEGQGLLAVALCTGGCVKLLKVDEASMEVTQEVGSMSAELFELFAEEDEKHVALRCCAGGGNLVYVYSDSKFKDYAACVCELTSDGSCTWYQVPPLPAPVNRFDRVTCLSSTVPVACCT